MVGNPLEAAQHREEGARNRAYDEWRRRYGRRLDFEAWWERERRRFLR